MVRVLFRLGCLSKTADVMVKIIMTSACKKKCTHTKQTFCKHTLYQYFTTQSLNMYLLLIMLEINLSWRAEIGARCYWQTDVAVTDNMRYSDILHCKPRVCVSLSLCFFHLTCPALLHYLCSPGSFLLQSGELRNDSRTKTFVTAINNWN